MQPTSYQAIPVSDSLDFFANNYYSEIVDDASTASGGGPPAIVNLTYSKDDDCPRNRNGLKIVSSA